MYTRSQFLRIYTVFKKAVKMSDFSPSLEDIDLLINCRTGRLMQPTKFYTILFWRSIGAIRNRLLIHGSPFHAVAQFYFGDPLGQSETDSLFTGYVFTQIYSFSFTKDKTLCSFRVANIYPPGKNTNGTSDKQLTTYLFLRFSFDDELFRLKIYFNYFFTSFYS